MEGSSGQPLVSGEGVRLELAGAGVASRMLAALLDALVEVAALALLALISIATAGGSDSDALRAAVIVETVLVLAGYPIVIEWLTKGRTLGKLTLGLRVVRDDGGPIGFRHALVRGLAGLILEKPGLVFPLTTFVGVATTTFSAREKRIGDMMAGTVVLNENSAPQALAVPPGWVPSALQHWVLSLEMSRVDDRLALAMRQFVTRAYQMTPEARQSVGDELRGRLEAVTSPPAPRSTHTPDVLMGVLAERRRRAAAGETGPRLAPAPSWSSSAPPPPPPPPPSASTAGPQATTEPGAADDGSPFIAPS